MQAASELEVGIQRRAGDRYAVELRYSQPGAEVDLRVATGEGELIRVDWDRLRRLEDDPAAYGNELGRTFFGGVTLAGTLAQARSQAQSAEAPLRLRLAIGTEAGELHGLRWETLRLPADGTMLVMSEQVLFSRYLSSFDWRPVRLRAKTDLRSVVVVANPTDLGQWSPPGREGHPRPLAPVDVPGELARARAGLEGTAVRELGSGGAATLDGIFAELRNGCDILYLVCHGALIEGEPWLWLEKEDGSTARVSGTELVERIKELQRCPRVVFLASCQSSGTGGITAAGDDGALAALGPRLAEAGVPAVFAMQGYITLETIAQFMPVLFRELQRDGQIDRAVAVARGTIRDRPDWWVPVLYLRLKGGRIWYVPGFAGGEDPAFPKWPALISYIEGGRCTPILGPGLLDSLLGSWREVAQRWADTYQFPMAPYYREDLAQVAQYLAVQQDPQFPRNELIRYLEKEIRRRHKDVLPAEAESAPLGELVKLAADAVLGGGENEPHRVLAELPLPIYVTTSFADYAAHVLAKAGRPPRTELCRWNADLEDLPSIYDEQPDYRPEPKQPMVYHIFGRLEEPDSLVLTEDDYFDYLIGVTGNKDLIPRPLRRALADTALLFLGFHIEDWSFRVFFRSIMKQEGGSRRKRYTHVAVQIDPEEGRILEPARAREYLEQYFEGADISIYWGSAQDFLAELGRRWRARKA